MIAFKRAHCVCISHKVYALHTHTHIQCHPSIPTQHTVYVNRTIWNAAMASEQVRKNESQMDKRYCFWYFYGIFVSSFFFFFFFVFLSFIVIAPSERDEEEEDPFVMCVVFVHFSKRTFKRRQPNWERKNWKWSVNKSFRRRFFLYLSLFLPLSLCPDPVVTTDKS